MAIDFLTDVNLQVAIISPPGAEADAFLRLLGRTFLPNAIIGMTETKDEAKEKARSKKPAVGMLQGKACVGDRITVILCDAQEKVCCAPVHSTCELANKLEEMKKTYSLQ